MILQAPKRVRTEEYGPEQRIDGWGLGSPQQKARSASAHPLAYPYLTRDGGIILTTVLREATNQISSTLSDEATSVPPMTPRLVAVPTASWGFHYANVGRPMGETRCAGPRVPSVAYVVLPIV